MVSAGTTLRVLNGNPAAVWTAVGLALALSPNLSDAASPDGKYAAKEAGLESCERYVEERANASDVSHLFVGWLAGYLSAYNRLTPDTVDIAPWQSVELMANLLEGYCQERPEIPFAHAVDALIAGLMPTRLRVPSDRVEVRSGEHALFIYEHVLARAQQALAERGFYDGPVKGVFDDATEKAFDEFQKINGIVQTGLPDQATLFQLFR